MIIPLKIKDVYMAKVAVIKLEIGMRLSEDVYDDDGLLLISSDTLVQTMHIDFMKRKGVDYVYVYDQAEMEPPVPLRGLNTTLELEEKYRITTEKFKDIYKGYRLGRVPVYEEIEDVIEPLYEDMLSDETFARKVWQIHSYDDYTFDHSVRVAMISGLLSKWCGHHTKAIKNAAMAGLLHDIGKCNIPDEILNKPGALNEDEMKVMKTHSILGYILIKEMKSLPIDVQLGVLQHHEREDGTGYPNALKSSEICYVAKIVAIADVYCAMTQDRPYKKAMHPFDAMSYILEKCHSSLDFSISKTFLANVAHFYIGHKVILNDGLQGEIIMTYKDDPARPMVRVGDDYIDLRRNLKVEITNVIEES